MSREPAWYERIQSLPRQVVYLVLIAVMFIPLVRPLGLPLNSSANTRAAFQVIDAIPEGGLVWHSIGFNPAVDGETWPQMLALSRQYMSKGLKIIYFPTMQEGGMYAERIKSTHAAEYDYKYGEDYVVLPFKAGGETAIAGLRDFDSMFTRDAYGTRLADLPLLRGFVGLQDVSAIVATTGGDDPVSYVKHIVPVYNMPFVACGTAPLLPLIGPFISSGQIKGAVIGLAGAAEYEILAGVPGSATGAMDAQAMGHLLIVVLVFLGNLGLALQRMTRNTQEVTRSGR